MGKDGSLKDSLNSMLSFYKENRELIAMLSGMTKNPSALAAAFPPPEADKKTAESGETQQKSRSEQTGNYKILEEFLKTHGV